MGKHMAHLISLMNLTEIHLYLITNDCNRYWEQGEYRKEIKKAINPIYKRRKKKTHLQVEHHKISSELVSRKKVCDPMDFRPDWSTTDAVQVIDMTTGRAIKEKNIYTSSMPRYWESFWFNQWYNNFDKSKKLGLWGRISK